jgi:aspartyl/asparaginyl beta-hydroxylase (cupin superfamily)
MGMLNNPAWSAYFLWKNGEPVPEHAARCPKTLHALRNAPLAKVPWRSPSILFSLLQPGTRIPPHNGLINTRLICHLPLIVPGKCVFRVGNDQREWAEGKAWAFDDTIEHEAWNDSDRTRVILLFDVWRPELTDEERSLVVSLFEAIDAHSGRKPEWEI